jgi:hypothetical protein
MSKLSADIRIGRISPQDRRVKAIAIFLDRPNDKARKAQEYGAAFEKLSLADTVNRHNDNILFVYPHDRAGGQKFVDAVVDLARELFTVTEVKG